MSIPNFVCCPECNNTLIQEESSVLCEICDQIYPVSVSKQIDLRPRRNFIKTAQFTIDTIEPLWSKGGKSSVTLRDVDVCTLGQIIPFHSGAKCFALEVGCGSRHDVRNVIEKAGYDWVGVDWLAESATYLADGHALPFRDGSFPLVASDAVLEHMRYPHLAIQEMARVLQPGGVLVGEVAFLQPFHSSYFHMTYEAILDLVRYAGLEPMLYANGSASSFLYLAKRALGKWAWCAWPADWIFRNIAKRKQITPKSRNHDINWVQLSNCENECSGLRFSHGKLP